MMKSALPLLLIAGVVGYGVYEFTKKPAPPATGALPTAPADKAAMIVAALYSRTSPSITAPIETESNPVVIYGSTAGAPAVSEMGVVPSSVDLAALLDAGRYVFVDKALLNAANADALPMQFDLVAVHPSALVATTNGVAAPPALANYVLLQAPTKAAPALPKANPNAAVATVPTVTDAARPTALANINHYIASTPAADTETPGMFHAAAVKIAAGGTAPAGSTSLAAVINSMVAAGQYVFVPTSVVTATDDSTLYPTTIATGIDPKVKAIDAGFAGVITTAGYQLIAKPGDAPLVVPVSVTGYGVV